MFYKTDGSVPFYKSDILDGVIHGFATRHGGKSVGKYTRSMNFAYGRGDDDSTVVENFEIFAKAIGAKPENGIMLGQIHSSTVLNVTEKEFGLGVYMPSELCLDGYVSSTSGALLCVRVADCIPVLFADKDAGVIGAVHAGWRGAAGKIGANCVEKMKELGADIGNIKAAIGPGICRDCYTVGEDFHSECKNLVGCEMCNKFISYRDGRLHADLKGLNKLVLLESGIKEENIDVSSICTSCNHEDFFSHRYHKQNRGTLCAMIALA